MHETQVKPHLQCGTDPNMIRPWSAHDPTTHETVSHPSHRRGRSSTFGDALCLEKHGVSCICSLKNAFRARLPSKLHRQLIHQHHLQSHLQWGSDPWVANHNGIPSANSSTNTTCNPIYIVGTILQLQITMEFCRPQMHETQVKPHFQCGTDPSMIRPWSENDPTTPETVSHPSHRRGRSSTFEDGLCMEKHRLSCICYLSKTHFVRDFTSKLHRQLLHQHHLQCHLHCGNDPTLTLSLD